METFLQFIEKIGIYKIIIGLLAFNLGLKFPDWDFAFKLKHRNILTHSPLIILVLLNLYMEEKSEFLRLFISTFSMGMALHFIFDFFPKGWVSSALLHVPLVNLQLKKIISILLFAGFILSSFYISQAMTKSFSEYILVGIFSLVTIFKSIKKENKFFRPFITFSILFLLIGSMKYNMIEISQDIYSHLVKQTKSLNKII